MKIALCGAGIGGLAATIALHTTGHEIHLFERFASPRPIGAGLMIQPTGLAALACLGLDAHAIALGRALTGISGDTVAGRPIFDIGYREIGPACFALGMHRGALFQILHDRVQALGIPIAGGHEIATSGLAGDQRTITSRAGRHLGAFDLVVDATGTKSPLRPAHADVLLDRPYPYGAVWGVVPEPADWPHPQRLRQRYDGCGVMIGVLPIGTRAGETTPLSAVFWSLRTADFPAWRSAGLGAWQDQVIRRWPQARPFVERFASVDDLTFAAYADVRVRRPYGDHIVFLGDAGRSASPQLGQGANLALIDAVVLAACLEEKSSLAEALGEFDARRRAHTRFYGIASRWLTPFFQSDSAAAGHVRDTLFGPLAKIPYVRREMVRTLAGIKTGLFSHFDPGGLHPRYALAAPAPAPVRQPAG